MKELWFLIFWCCNPLPIEVKISENVSSIPQLKTLTTSSDTVKEINDLSEKDSDLKFCVIHDGKYYDVVLKHEEPTRLEEIEPETVKIDRSGKP